MFRMIDSTAIQIMLQRPVAFFWLALRAVFIQNIGGSPKARAHTHNVTFLFAAVANLVV